MDRKELGGRGGGVRRKRGRQKKEKGIDFEEVVREGGEGGDDPSFTYATINLIFCVPFFFLPRTTN